MVFSFVVGAKADFILILRLRGLLRVVKGEKFDVELIIPLSLSELLTTETELMAMVPAVSLVCGLTI